MNESFIIKAAELSSSAFMLIIVLILTSKMYNIFTQTTEKLDKITTELSDSNKQLSNQLTKCIMMQENVLNTLKDTMTSTEDTYIHIINLENKIDNLREIDKKEKVDKQNTYDLMRENESWQMVDPLDIKKIISDMEDDILKFESEVDFVLSTSNAETVIEVDIDEV